MTLLEEAERFVHQEPVTMENYLRELIAELELDIADRRQWETESNEMAEYQTAAYHRGRGNAAAETVQKLKGILGE